METYKRKVNYYETDRMDIVHHSNYIRYFEEARIAFMDYIGCGMAKMEAEGLIIPNVDAYAKYVTPLKFGDEFEVKISSCNFNGVKMKFEYELYRTSDSKLSCTGHTTHCFVDKDYKPIRINKTHPEIYNKLKAANKF